MEKITEYLKSFRGTATWYEAVLVRRVHAMNIKEARIMVEICLSKIRPITGSIEIPWLFSILFFVPFLCRWMTRPSVKPSRIIWVYIKSSFETIEIPSKNIDRYAISTCSCAPVKPHKIHLRLSFVHSGRKAVPVEMTYCLEWDRVRAKTDQKKKIRR